MNWKTIGIVIEGQKFDIEGLNVWDHDWVSLNQPAEELPHPSYPTELHWMHGYQIKKGDQVITFAAGELSPNVWGFYVPA